MSGVQGIGIGPALQKARQMRGKSIEEASRETHIRAEYLQAMEGEKFESGKAGLPTEVFEPMRCGQGRDRRCNPGRNCRATVSKRVVAGGE